MAGNKMTNDLSNDLDIEPDGEPVCLPEGRLNKLMDNFTKNSGKHSQQIDSGLESFVSTKDPLSKLNEKFSKSSDKHSGRIDSGLGSSLELKYSSLESASDFVDKAPVQCSDACENSDDDLQSRLSKLNVTDDIVDEGHYSMNLKSVESTNVSEPETLDIEIDLAERDEDGDTLTHVAIVSLKREVALALIDIADTYCLNIQNYLLQSPLHLAVLTSQIDVVKSLISKKVDVTLRDQQGNTALHIACRIGDRDSVSMIVQSFGNDAVQRKKYFSMKNCEGLSCLHVAAQQKEFIILGHLFAKGGDVNIGDAKSGRTMLHYAVERNDIETVSLLLTHPNIDIDCKTFKGETPLVLAFWRNYQDIVKRLKTKGAYFSYDVIEESDDETST